MEIDPIFAKVFNAEFEKSEEERPSLLPVIRVLSPRSERTNDAYKILAEYSRNCY